MTRYPGPLLGVRGGILHVEREGRSRTGWEMDQERAAWEQVAAVTATERRRVGEKYTQGYVYTRESLDQVGEVAGPALPAPWLPGSPPLSPPAPRTWIFLCRSCRARSFRETRLGRGALAG